MKLGKRRVERTSLVVARGCACRTACNCLSSASAKSTMNVVYMVVNMTGV